MNIDNEGEDWSNKGEPQIDNEGEDWGDGGDEQIDNEGEEWGASNAINNEGEDWSQPKPTNKPTPNAPTQKPTPRAPTAEPTDDPTINLYDHLENLKTTYFCSESWDNIDCENAQACPSGDSKGECIVPSVCDLFHISRTQHCLIVLVV